MLLVSALIAQGLLFPIVSPQFPSFKDNYIQTVVQPAQEAEAESRRIAQEQSLEAPRAAPGVNSDHSSWLIAAGIERSLWADVDYIVSRESGWNPNAINASSGSCGLGQQLPCGKWPGAWNDPVAALKAMNTYVGQYGGWAGACLFWRDHHYY